MTGASLVGRAAIGLFAARPLALSGRSIAAPRRVVVVGNGENPTLDFYLRPRLDGTVASAPHAIVELGRDPATVLADGDLVVFCRYVTPAWIAAVRERRDRLAGIGLLLDDDIAAVIADATTPMGYRLRLVWRHLRHLAALTGLLDRLWVSTSELATRFPAAAAEVLPPVAGVADRPVVRRATTTAPRLAYHATGVHDAEHARLAPILARLAAARPQVTIEVAADGPRLRHWRGIPGITLVAPTDWPSYRARTRAEGFDLMLAPLIDTPVNRCRSATKRIDAYRAGAALLTDAPAIYRPTAEEAGLGMVAPAEADGFLAALVGLVDDPERLARLAALNAAEVEGWGRRANGLV